MDAHSGKRAFYLGTQWDPHYQGDWGKLEQKVAVGTVGVNDSQPNNIDQVNDLHSPWPNPSTRGAGISYQLAAKSRVNLKIYDISGRAVKTLVDDEQEPGYHQVNWDGNESNGKQLASGVYFHRILVNPIGKPGKYSATRKLILIR
jgi:flagellar hook assembly protein FlgD